MTVLSGTRVVVVDRVLDPGWVSVHDGRIDGVGDGAPRGGSTDLGGGWLLPGFVDLHVHGGYGHDLAASAADMRAGVAYHRTRGTTRTLVSLMAAPLDALSEQLGWVAELGGRGPHPEGHVLGTHLEGPFLSRTRCGAQSADHLRLPDRAELAALLDAGRGFVRSVTLAPELPGALELIDDACRAGVISAVGHTDATYEQAAHAFGRGASLATHLFDSMRPVHHREPGPVLAALDADVACEVINDGVHVHPAAVRVVTARGADRLVLVTDAMAAAGIGDGHYRLGGQEVIVAEGQARLASTGSLAGSTLTMDAAVRRAVVDVGLPVPVAAAAASTNPARVLGLGSRCGAIAPGLDADLVHLDDAFDVRRVMAQGDWVA